MICMTCGGSDIHGTCVCNYEYPPEPDMSHRMLTDNLDGLDPYMFPDEPEIQPKQICHFCGVDLFLPNTDVTIRMCVPCGLALNHEECCRCIVCNKTWLVDECVDVASGSVCEICKSL